MSTESIVVVGAIVASIVVGAFSRVWGRVVGLVLVAGLLGWGVHVYDRGGQLGFFGQRLEPPYFYWIIGALLVWELIALGLALRARREAAEEAARERAEEAAAAKRATPAAPTEGSAP